MIFNRTGIYSVYVRKDVSDPLATAVFVSSGFSIFAFLFFGLWALANRMWIIGVLLCAVSGFFIMNSSVSMELISVLVSLWFGLEANNLKAWSLEQKGYILVDVVIGADAISAERKFFEKYLSYKQVSA